MHRQSSTHMDKDVNARALCVALWLIVCSGSASGQDYCVTIQQDAISLLHHPTKLVCRVKETIISDFILVWQYRTTETASVERRGDHVIVSNHKPDLYDCEWIESEASSALTIKSTALHDEGQWFCLFMSSDGCTDTDNLDIEIMGMIVKFQTCTDCLTISQALILD